MSGLAASVVVPSYRSAATIRGCLSALLAQDVGQPFEVLVVDSSDDGTADIVAREFPSVRLIARSVRTEAPVARNLGLHEARGERVAFIDSDCAAPPDWLRRLAAALDEGYDGVGGAIANGNPDSLVSWAGYIAEFREFLPGGPRRSARYMTPGNVAYRRATLLAVGGFPAGCFPLEDQVLGRSLEAVSARLCVDPSIVVAHTHRTDLHAFLEHQKAFGRRDADVLRRLSLPGAVLARRRWRAALALPGLVPLKFLRTLYACRNVDRSLWRRRPRVAWLSWRGTCAWGRGFFEGSGPSPTPVLVLGQGARALLPDSLVSVVVATRDRPEVLRECLRGLKDQRTDRPLEIVVVDNNPSSGLTPPVVAEFPGVRLVEERRRGLSYARNAGLFACRGEVIATTDDDVSFPPGWLEALMAPFSRPEVAVVTGSILPLSLDTAAERAFDVRGSLVAEGTATSFDRSWFDSFRLRAVPTWKLGTGANAAFRRGLFADPAIGLFDERLGVGTPCGAGEESYLFYRALKAGAVVRYEPGAAVRHRHHSTMEAVGRRVFDYSKGHVAYHLCTLLDDGDPRAVAQVLVGQPLDILRRFVRHTLVERTYPARLVACELLGYAAGPLELVRSALRVRREGRSQPLRALPAGAELEVRRSEPAGVALASDAEGARGAEERA